MRLRPKRGPVSEKLRIIEGDNEWVLNADIHLSEAEFHLAVQRIGAGLRNPWERVQAMKRAFRELFLLEVDISQESRGRPGYTAGPRGTGRRYLVLLSEQRAK